MNHEEFEEVFETTVDACRKVLVTKAAEYATADRLHNFRVAAKLQGISERAALAGMMAKHTVSVYDLLMKDECAGIYTWEEKVGDHLNYLFLLMAVVEDEIDGPSEASGFTPYPHRDWVTPTETMEESEFKDGVR